MRSLFKTKTMLMMTTLIVIIGCQNATLTHKHNDRFINELVIFNNTNYYLENIVLINIDTGTNVSCSSILPRSQCSVGFSKLPITTHRAVIQWLDPTGTYQKDVIASNLDSIPNMTVSKIVIEIEDLGIIKVYYEQ